MSVASPCGFGSQDVPSLRPTGTWKELLKHSDHYPDAAGKGASGVRAPKGLIKGLGGTCQQVTEAPHCRLQLGGGSRVTSHVLLVAEAQEPQLLHHAFETDRPTDRQTARAVAVPCFLRPPSCFRP